MPAEFGAPEIYDYRVPLGLALTALDGPTGALDLFEHVGAAEQQKTQASRRSVVLAAAIAVVMFIALLVAWYAVDMALARRLNAQGPIRTEAARHTRPATTVARHRPDAATAPGRQHGRTTASGWTASISRRGRP
jgi:hypothetical protein